MSHCLARHCAEHTPRLIQARKRDVWDSPEVFKAEKAVVPHTRGLIRTPRYKRS